jgi:nitrite reductase/ring-hydroxylating ferredoxin subunit
MTARRRVRLCRVEDVPADAPLRVLAGDVGALALCPLGDGTLRAVSDTCTHGMASLSEGFIEDGKIVCPFHGGSFDLLSGRPVDRPCTIPIDSYAVEERNGELFIVLGEARDA